MLFAPIFLKNYHISRFKSILKYLMKILTEIQRSKNCKNAKPTSGDIIKQNAKYPLLPRIFSENTLICRMLSNYIEELNNIKVFNLSKSLSRKYQPRTRGLKITKFPNSSFCDIKDKILKTIFWTFYLPKTPRYMLCAPIFLKNYHISRFKSILKYLKKILAENQRSKNHKISKSVFL